MSTTVSMSTTPISQKTDTAPGKIRIAIQRLAGRYRFHAKVLERFNVLRRPEVETMGVTAAGDAIKLYYNPDFVERISLDELGGVLLHEVHHVLFRHIFADPADYPDRWARIVAEEVTVNEFITEPLPGNPILLKAFPKLPRMESTDRRYRRLTRHNPRFPIVGAGGEVLAGTRGTARGKKSGVPDDHSVWDEAKTEGQRAEAAVRAAIQDAALQVDPSAIPDYLKQALAGMGIGSISGDGEYALHKTARGQLDWRRLLRRYTGQVLTIQYDFRRPSRRFPNLVGVIPGRRRQGGRPKVMAVIDTSGSITPELLEQIDAELARLASQHEVLVVECDAEIHNVYPYKPVRSVSGRGGTDFQPPLEASFLRRHGPELIIYFTDGYGPAPDNAPQVPVVWCLTPDGEKPASWGRVIQMGDHGR